MNKRTGMRLSLPCAIAAYLLTSVVWAGDTPNDHSYEFVSMLGAAGQPAQRDDEFTSASGAYYCKNASTRSTPHIVRYPFSLPDTRTVFYADISGRRTSDAPPMELSVYESCMHWTENDPTRTLINSATPYPDTDGYFDTVISLHASQPNNYDCKYWVEARFDISSIACTTGTAYIQKIRIENKVTDRIFRGMFNINAPLNTP